MIKKGSSDPVVMALMSVGGLYIKTKLQEQSLLKRLKKTYPAPPLEGSLSEMSHNLGEITSATLKIRFLQTRLEAFSDVLSEMETSFNLVPGSTLKTLGATLEKSELHGV